MPKNACMLNITIKAAEPCSETVQKTQYSKVYIGKGTLATTTPKVYCTFSIIEFKITAWA